MPAANTPIAREVAETTPREPAADHDPIGPTVATRLRDRMWFEAPPPPPRAIPTLHSNLEHPARTRQWFKKDR